MDFRLKDGEQVRTTIAKKESATVIEAGDLVALASGYIIKATAASAAVAWCPNGAGAGVTDVEVTVGNEFTLLGTADASFAITHKGAEVDIVVNTGAQQVDVGASATDVFKVGISSTAGTVGSASNVEVRLNKVLY
jgi:hypothetical protein